MNQSPAAELTMEAAGTLPSILTEDSLKELSDWLDKQGMPLGREKLFKMLEEEEARVRVHNDKQLNAKDVVNSRVQQLLNLMKKNRIQVRSQELILSTYEYTALQLEEQLRNFQLRDVLDKEEDLSEQTQ